MKLLRNEVRLRRMNSISSNARYFMIREAEHFIICPANYFILQRNTSLNNGFTARGKAV